MPESDASLAKSGAGPPDWNVVVTLPENTYREARRLLAKWGKVRRTGYFNVLALKVPDAIRFLGEFVEAVRETPGILNIVSHVMPAQAVFDFQTSAEFEKLARQVVLGWIDRLANKRFHVRLHRRGLKGVLSTPAEERFLDEALLVALHAMGASGQIGFDDPDAMIQIETIDGRAGLSLWTREDLQKCDFLGWR